MAGYSQTPLVKKLEPLPDSVRLTSAQRAKQFDFIMLFVDSARTLQKELPRLKQKLARDDILWVS